MLPSSPLTFPDPRNGRLLGEQPHFPPAQQLPNGKAASFPPSFIPSAQRGSQRTFSSSDLPTEMPFAEWWGYVTEAGEKLLCHRNNSSVRAQGVALAEGITRLRRISQPKATIPSPKQSLSCLLCKIPALLQEVG